MIPKFEITHFFQKTYYIHEHNYQNSLKNYCKNHKIKDNLKKLYSEIPNLY